MTEPSVFSDYQIEVATPRPEDVVTEDQVPAASETKNEARPEYASGKPIRETIRAKVKE